jgi:prepilin-type N-terminal cleavage/methylation domain-containing protein
MKPNSQPLRGGFTLLETVIAIGVFSVLLTGFIIVFAPAIDGIRKSINSQQADQLVSSLETELVTLRPGGAGGAVYDTGFDKAFDWIRQSNNAADALVAYQYRGKLDTLRPDDKTPEPEPSAQGKILGKDYVMVPAVRRKSDSKFTEDLAAVEGSVYLVKCNQMVLEATGMNLGIPGVIRDPKPSGAPVVSSADYPEAVIAFSAEFHLMPAKDPAFFTGNAFNKKFTQAQNAVFTRNLAVCR